MINALLTGKLFKDPKLATGKNGTPYCTTSIRVPQEVSREGEPDSVFASVIAFGSDAEKLSRLRAGDAVSVAGSVRVGVWTNNEGKTTPSLNIQATGILSAYDVKQRRPRPNEEPESKHNHEVQQAATQLYGRGSLVEPDFDDPLTF